MTKALVPSPSPMPAPDMLDVAGMLLGVARGQPDAARLTLIEAAQLLIGRVRDDLQLTEAQIQPAAKQPARESVKTAPAKPAPDRPAPTKATGEGNSEQVETITHNGVTVELGSSAGLVEFGGNEIAVSLRQARLVACLARAMPQPVGREFIAAKLWPGARPPAEYGNIISTLIAPLIGPLAGIGLTLKTVRGVGVALQREEAA